MKPTKPNWAALAGLRYILALIVVAVHLPTWANPSRFFDFIGSANGAMAVIAFLVISGFSIRASLDKEIEGFYARRIARIYPLYLLSVVLASGLMFVYGPVMQTLNQGIEAPEAVWPFMVNVIGLQSVLAPALAFNSPAWSIGLEIFFYLLAPLLLRLPDKATITLIGLSGLVYFLYPPFSVYAFGAVTVAQFVWPWFLGWILYKWRDKVKESPALVFGVLGFACFIASSNNAGGKLWPVVMVATIYAIVYGHDWKLQERAAKVALYLGELSYPIYILHFPTGLFLWKQFGLTSPFAHVAACLGVSVVAYHLIDKPMRSRAAKKLSRADAKNPAPVAAPASV